MVGGRAAHAMNEHAAGDRGRRNSCLSRSDERERTEWPSARSMRGDIRARRTNLTFSTVRGSDAGHLEMLLSCRRDASQSVALSRGATTRLSLPTLNAQSLSLYPHFSWLLLFGLCLWHSDGQ